MKGHHVERRFGWDTHGPSHAQLTAASGFV
jgi:isoleucyl-tRNA synthetase